MARLLLLFSLLLAAFGSFAQEASFLIERIEVRGTRFTSADVIRKQTLLREGGTYTEAQIKAAVDRINRLPFVVDAEPSLEKGSEREQYVLAIRVTEIKPLFVDAHSTYSKLSGAPGARWNDESGVETGARFFLGSTLVHASTDFRGRYNLGVTQYDLFGSSAYASAIVSWTDRRTFSTLIDPDSGATSTHTFESKPSIGLLAGIPLNGNNSIQLTWSRASATSTSTFNGQKFEDEFTGQSATAAWIYDSTDDALFPTRGTTGRAGVFAAKTQASRNAPSFEQQTAFAEGRRYWNFSGQQSVSAGVSAALMHTPQSPFVFNREYDTQWAVVGGYSTSLWPRTQTIRWGDLRFETTAEYSSSSQFQGLHYATLTSGVAFRNPWGLLRFNVELARQVNP